MFLNDITTAICKTDPVPPKDLYITSASDRSAGCADTLSALNNTRPDPDFVTFILVVLRFKRFPQAPGEDISEVIA